MDGLECCERNKTSLVEGVRFDSELYQRKYALLEDFAKTHNMTTFSKEASTVKKGIFDISASCYSSSGIPFVRISNLKGMFLSQNDLVYIPEEENEKNVETQLVKGDIILSKTGSPAASYVSFDTCNASQDTVAIKLKPSSQIVSGYVVVYLNTVYGLAQMEKRFTGNIQKHLNLDDCKRNLLIPVFCEELQNKTQKLLLASLHDSEVANQLYKDAQDIFQAQLTIPKIPKQSEAILSLNKSFKRSCRLDAEYYQPKYMTFYECLQKFRATTIPSEYYVFKNVGSNYAEGTSDVGVIKTKQLSNDGINLDGIESYFDSQVCIDNKSTFLQNNDVVFAAMGVGSLGKVSLFSHDGAEKYVTDSTLRIYRAKPSCKIRPEVLCVFLQSQIGQELIYRYVVGSTGIINIYDDDMAKIPIPVLDDAIQEEIAAKVQESFALQKQAKQLLEHAKQAVEMAIERGEELALEWLKDKVG